MVSRGNGGKTPILFSTLGGGDPVFVEMQVVGAAFDADLVTDPTDAAQVAAAIGSDLEIIVEWMSKFGTIIGVAVDGNYLELMFGYGSSLTAFDDTLTNDLIVAPLLAETGFNATVTIADSIRSYQFATPT
jgi:hypothetical protein